jgi:beta-lactamase regulating signal transducer with metallopeptidase domain
MNVLNDVGGVVAAWLVTYAVHSTLLLGAAWVVNRKLALGVSGREGIWKAATVGGLVTATLQSGLIGWSQARPLAGRYALTPTSEVVQPLALAASHVTARPTDLPTNTTSEIATTEFANEFTASPAGENRFEYPFTWPATLVLLWLAGFTVQALRLRRRRKRMYERLGARVPLSDAHLWEMLESVKARARVQRNIQITVSRNNISPVVVSAREICLPDGLLPRLSAAQCESMLAHEVAHIARRDPQWLMTYAWLEALFFFQPLNRHARTQVQSAAEYLCDDWATRHVGSRVALAQCLVEVARWMTHSPEPLPHPAMAEHGSILFSRVERLLDGSRELTHARTALWWSVPLALIVVTCLAPAVTRTSGVVVQSPEVQESPIAAAINKLGTGLVRFEYPARPSVCGTGVEKDGTRMIALSPDRNWLPSGATDRLAMYISDTRKLMRHDLGTDGTWTTPCLHGDARVDLQVRERRIISIEVTVGRPAPPLSGDHWVHLDVIPARMAAGYLMSIADTISADLAERALLGAVIARDVVDGSVLTRLASLRGVQPSRTRPARVSDLKGDLAVIADLKESWSTRIGSLQQATRAGLTVEDVIAAYDKVPDRAMRVELIKWLGERRNEAVVRKLQQIVRDAIVLEEQQAALEVLGQQKQGVSNELSRHIGQIDEGVARFSFAARPEACGSGVDRDGAGMFALLPTKDWSPAGSPGQAAFFSFDADDFSRLSLSPDPSWTRKCQNGPVYVDLTIRDRRIASLQISVGNPTRPLNAESVKDVRDVTSRDAASYLLSIARTSRQTTIATNAILAAMLAKDVVIYPQLLEIATDASRPERIRQTALRWVALDPSPAARDALEQRADDLPRGDDADTGENPAALGDFIARIPDFRHRNALKILLDDGRPLATRKQAIHWADDEGIDPGVLAELYDRLPYDLKLYLIEWMADCDQESTARKLIHIAKNDADPKLRATARLALASHKHPLARNAARELR